MVEAGFRLRDIDPALLLLEITETALMADPATALESLTALKELGVGLAVDDFGTGYSSLTINGLGLDSGDSAIVGSCIDLAHAVGIRAVAEGVETSGRVRALKAMGCDLAQGYHFARPLPAPLLKGWLDAHGGGGEAVPA